MLGVLGLKFEGRPHCGIDDASNIAKVLLNLIDDFAVLDVNEQLDLRTLKYRERALLKAAISTLESGESNSDEQLVRPFSLYRDCLRAPSYKHPFTCFLLSPS